MARLLIEEQIAGLIRKAVGDDALAADVSVPEKENFGHYSTNVAMRLRTPAGAPLDRAKALAEKIATGAPAGFFERVEAVPPGFINFWLSKQTIAQHFAAVAREKEFGTSDVGGGKTVIVEYSSVNIAKIMNVGHLRNTILGAALANIHEALGYRVVRWNYLGDWGTQFGKLIAAYKAWGDKRAVEERPLEELQKLYVRFHQEEKESPELAQRGQEEFKKLEAGDRENIALWEWFKKESMKKFEAAYRELGVDFDVWIGESFYNKEVGPLVEELVKKGVAVRSEGAIVIKLDEFNLPPALIQKTDGASVYMTRDIANLRYRLKKYKPAKVLYVIGNEQSFQFEQLFAVARKLGMESAELTHIKYGLVLGESGKKFSTREGNTVSMRDIVAKAVRLAREVVEKKNPDLTAAEKDEVARAVALGALKYFDLKEGRTTDIVFDWDQMLDLTGDSAPYLQYTHARLMNIVRKAGQEGMGGKENDLKKAHFDAAESEPELALMRKVFEFPAAVRAVGESYSTSVLAVYLYKLAVAANRFYETTPVLKEEDPARRAARLALIAVAARTLHSGLALFGIVTPEKI